MIMDDPSDNQKIQRYQLEKFKRCYSNIPEGEWESPPHRFVEVKAFLASTSI